MKTILTFLLLLLTTILAFILLIPSFIYMLIRSILHKGLRNYFYRIAFSLDQLGNVVCGEMLNDWLIKPEGYRFGAVDVTISHVIGTNLKNNTLYPFGKGVAKTIDFFAYIFVKEKNHCLNAADKSQINLYK